MTRRVHIDHLVLPAGTVGRERVRAAVEREVARALAAAPRDAQPAGERRLSRVEARVQSSASPDALGRAVAAAVTGRSEG